MSDKSFHPSFAQLIASNLYLSHFKTPRMGLGDLSDLSFSTKVRYQFVPVDLDNGLISAYLEAHISLDRYLDAGYTIGSNFLFRIYDAKTYVKETKFENNIQINYDLLLERTLASESYSTLRGLSIPTISQTAYRGLYLPVVDADQILESDQIELEELIDTLKPVTSKE